MRQVYKILPSAGCADNSASCTRHCGAAFCLRGATCVLANPLLVTSPGLWKQVDRRPGWRWHVPPTLARRCSYWTTRSLLWTRAWAAYFSRSAWDPRGLWQVGLCPTSNGVAWCWSGKWGPGGSERGRRHQHIQPPPPSVHAKICRLATVGGVVCMAAAAGAGFVTMAATSWLCDVSLTD